MPSNNYIENKTLKKKTFALILLMLNTITTTVKKKEMNEFVAQLKQKAQM